MGVCRGVECLFCVLPSRSRRDPAHASGEVLHFAETLSVSGRRGKLDEAVRRRIGNCQPNEAFFHSGSQVVAPSWARSAEANWSSSRESQTAGTRLQCPAQVDRAPANRQRRASSAGSAQDGLSRARSACRARSQAFRRTRATATAPASSSSDSSQL